MDCWLTFNSKNDQSTGFQAVDLIWWVMTSVNSNSLLDELMCRAHFDSAEPHLIWSHGLLIDLICYICIWSEWLLYNANSAFSFSYFEVQAYVCREITNYICNLQIPTLCCVVVSSVILLLPDPLESSNFLKHLLQIFCPMQG
jgi:hypothetical protein